MARMESDGLEEVNKMMEELGLMFDDAFIDDVLHSGADISKVSWESAISERTDEHTGQLASSIKVGKISKSRDGKQIVIYPQGNRTDGKRNATVAFILNYSSRYPKQNGMVELADAKAEPQIVARIEQMINNKINKIGE